MIMLGRRLGIKELFLEGCGKLSLPSRPPYEGLGIEGLASALGWEFAAQIAYATLLTSNAMKVQPAVTAMDTLSCLRCYQPKLLFSFDTRRSATNMDPHGVQVEVAKPRKSRYPEGNIRIPDISRFWYCEPCVTQHKNIESKMSVKVADAGGVRYDYSKYQVAAFDNREVVGIVFAEYIKDMS